MFNAKILYENSKHKKVSIQFSEEADLSNYENSKTAPTMHTFYEMLNRIFVNNAFDKRDKQHRMCAFYSKTIPKCQKLNSV